MYNKGSYLCTSQKLGNMGIMPKRHGERPCTGTIATHLSKSAQLSSQDLLQLKPTASTHLPLLERQTPASYASLGNHTSLVSALG